jgi:hypothetical protein
LKETKFFRPPTACADGFYQGCLYRNKSIGIASMADTSLVSLTESPILFDGSIACGIGDTFKAKNWQYSVTTLFTMFSLTVVSQPTRSLYQRGHTGK